MLDAEEIKVVREKFFTDPSWPLIEKMIRGYIDPLQSCLNIRADTSNDEIASEVRGRQIAYGTLDRFLVDAGILKPRITSTQTQFN